VRVPGRVDGGWLPVRVGGLIERRSRGVRSTRITLFQLEFRRTVIGARNRESVSPALAAPVVDRLINVESFEAFDLRHVLRWTGSRHAGRYPSVGNVEFAVQMASIDFKCEPTREVGVKAD
jgi:hypothetical protein